jgi:hypothetical protein
MRRHLPLGHQPLAPAGEQNHRGDGRGHLHGTSNLVAIDVRHAQVRDHHRARIPRGQDQQGTDDYSSRSGQQPGAQAAIPGTEQDRDKEEEERKLIDQGLGN